MGLVAVTAGLAVASLAAACNDDHAAVPPALDTTLLSGGDVALDSAGGLLMRPLRSDEVPRRQLQGSPPLGARGLERRDRQPLAGRSDSDSDSDSDSEQKPKRKKGRGRSG
jgi:hypothetical protein